MRGKAATTPSPEREYEVLKERNGLIHGQRRAVGDIFTAPESAMTFEVLEGVVALAQKKTEHADKKAKA